MRVEIRVFNDDIPVPTSKVYGQNLIIPNLELRMAKVDPVDIFDYYLRKALLQLENSLIKEDFIHG